MDLQWLLNPLEDEYLIQEGIQSHYRWVQHTANTHRVTVEVRLRPLDYTEINAFAQLIDRIGALVALARQYWRQYSAQNDPNRQSYLSFTIENANRSTIVNRPFRSHRRFETLQDITDNATMAILNAYENLAQSDNDFLPEDIVFNIRLDTFTNLYAQGRMKSYILKNINNGDMTKGLYKYNHEDDLCGFKCVLVHIMTMYHKDPQVVRDLFPWFLESFGDVAVTLPNLTATRRFHDFATKLARILNIPFPYDWVMTAGGINSSALKFVQEYPQFQVVVINENTRQIMEHRRGSLYQLADQEYGKMYTICMSYTLGHVKLIKGLFEYYGKTYQAGNIYCYDCLRIQTRVQHRCVNGFSCSRCYMRFGDGEALAEHCKGSVECGKCRLTFFNDHCLKYHRCTRDRVEVCDECGRQKEPNHSCSSYKCITCNQRVGAGHECQLQKPQDNNREDPRPEKEGEHYYAFDLESMILEQGENKLHTVNLCVVKKCFTGEEFIFNSLQDFERWLMTLEKPSSFFAHNMKGYDGRMIFDYLMDQCTPPQSIVWNGAKIMTMSYGKITFRDTLLHLPASLAQLPKMMGLNENDYKKGFFPHGFNRPEFQQYVGPMPPMEYFEPEMMSQKKKLEFMQWYDEEKQRVGNFYDFRRELIDYCVSDTRILAATIEAYMRQQMSRFPLNPLSCITIASYAMKMYMTYFLPDNALYRLSIKEDKRIRESMHGGRTDTRRMLREWSDEEVAAGYYGRYQDVQSLYPTVQFYDPLPVGRPQYKTWGPEDVVTDGELLDMFGFVCCDIECTQFLFHPIIVDMHENGRLVADLWPKKKIVIPTPELHLALKNGYKVTRVYYAYLFDYSTELFKDYFRTFLKDKLEASGLPKWIQTDEDWKEFQEYHERELGIDLDRSQMVSNASRKTGAKLLCNSLWGKFGERLHSTNWKACTLGHDDDEMMSLEKRWVDGEIDITYRKFNRMCTHIAMVYSLNVIKSENDYYHKQHLGKINIALASMVTSHARCRLWSELNKLGDRVLYHDTDSIIYERDPNGYNIPEGRYLGEWECETGGLPIVKFVSTGPKCYTYVIKDEQGRLKESSKVKGITLNAYNQTKINFDVMKQLVQGDLESVATKCLLFKYDRVHNTMITKTILKQFKQVYEKGEIDPNTWKVYPFGYQQFLPEIVRTS